MKSKYTAYSLTIGGIMVLLSRFSTAAPVPDAGSTLRDIEKKINAETPVFTPNPPIENLQATPPQTHNNELRFLVTAFKIEGHTRFSEEELQAILNPLIGREHSLSEIEDAIMSISRHYWKNNYPLAYAYIPPQDIKNGIVKISVVEGRYGTISIINKSNTKDAVINRFFSVEKEKYPIINSQRLERLLNILKEITETTEISSALSKGTEAKSSDLSIKINSAPAVTGNFETNNYGSSFTGKNHIEGALNWSNPFGLGDRLNTKVLSSGEGQDFFLLGYNIPVGAHGWRLGATYSDSTYQLGGEFSNLNAHGKASKLTLSANYPITHLQNKNLNLNININQKKLNDTIGTVALLTSNKTQYSGAVALNGQFALYPEHQSIFNVALEAGTLKTTIDQDTSRSSRGENFSKISYTASNSYAFSASATLSLAINGQKAFKNLDSSEKISLGGIYGVRAYKSGAGSGDKGYIANLELRYRTRAPFDYGQTVWILFADAGQVRINIDPAPNTPNKQNLFGVGTGLQWQLPYKTSLQIIHAIRGRHNEPGESNPRSRTWIQLSKSF